MNRRREMGSTSVSPIRKPTVDESASLLSQIPDEDHNLTLYNKVPYYLPCASWIPSYTFRKFSGDLIAGISLASFQIPLSMSYATAVAHVPPMCGLCGLAIAPIIYAFLGSVPQMIVGPEAAICLVVGQGVDSLLTVHKSIDPVELVGIITFLSGATLLGAGIGRCGFLDNVLSGALLRGFISGVGIVMITKSLVGELGLSDILSQLPTDETDHHKSPFELVLFLFRYRKHTHVPTALFALGAFLSLLCFRLVKKVLVRKNFKKAVFFPEILLVVIASTFICDYYDLDDQGVKVMGRISDHMFAFKFPFSQTNRKWVSPLVSTSFMAALLGFFESTTASKSLGSTYDLVISSNRELVALGALNIFASCFGGLPSFGGYGRSKINALSGATTCASGLVMGVVALLSIFFLLDFLYYLPVCVLSVITTIVGMSLLEEAPTDVAFHMRARGWNELIIFCLTVFTTIFYSVDAGIALGSGYSLIRVIKHSAQSRIHILGKLDDSDRFLNAETESSTSDSASMISHSKKIRQVEGCLIVKIPEPLTFTNTSDLRTRLKRLERYGSASTHPATPRRRLKSMTRFVVFDMEGMTGCDSSAAQILLEIVENYKKRGIFVFFTRVASRDSVRRRLANSRINRALISSSSELFNVDQSMVPYYVSVGDALKAVNEIELSSSFVEGETMYA